MILIYFTEEELDMLINAFDSLEHEYGDLVPEQENLRTRLRSIKDEYQSKD